MRVCLVYDCLFPWTVGGAERWMRNVAEALVRDGHDVTYLTRTQWEAGHAPQLPGVRVVAVSPAAELYDEEGKRRISPPLRFGIGVLRHLVRHGRRYDIVHTASFPYFSLLAAAAARGRGGYRLVADWHEVWSRDYWREYLGRLGWVGALVQGLCARVGQRAFCFSELHGRRLRAAGLRGEPTVLRGEWAGALERPDPVRAGSEVVFAGRLIPEKQAATVVGGVMRAARHRPDLRGAIFGGGPELGAVRAEIERTGAADVVRAPGFVAANELEAALRRALCLVLPSRREGYGMVVIEAASMGVPTVTVAGPDNAAVEHVVDGVNGFIAPDASPDQLAAAILAVADAGEQLRATTADWFAANAHELSIETSLERVLEAYRKPIARR